MEGVLEVTIRFALLSKTTFAREYLPNDARVLNFINADLIAAGLSPLAPQHAAITAARIMLTEIERLSAERLDFAFESTLSGRTYARRLEHLRDSGYDIEMIFLRISARVRQGGHPVPEFLARESNSSEYWVAVAYGADAHLRLKTNLDELSITALQDFSNFLHRWQFIPHAVDVRAWVDPRAFHAALEACGAAAA
jgi:hypothetical protein